MLEGGGGGGEEGLRRMPILGSLELNRYKRPVEKLRNYMKYNRQIDLMMEEVISPICCS